MCDRFKDIVDVKFTAQMEEELDEVESGKLPWKQLLRQFYGGFESNLHQVEKDMEGVYLKGSRRGHRGEMRRCAAAIW